MGIRKRHVNEFPTPYTCTAAIREGGMETKLSMVLMGFGNIMHKQKIKGLIYLAVEVAYVVFMVLNGIRFLSMLGTLGTVEQKEVWDEVNQIYTYTKGDQSVLILLYGVATILVTILMIWAWRGALKSAYKAECLDRDGRHVNSFVEDVKALLHENLHRLLMTPPMVFIFALTILPLIFMICMAFTNYSKIDNHLMLFEWVGLDNFRALFDSNSILEILLRSLLCRSDVCLPFDYENDASAGGSGQRVASESGTDCTGRQPSVFHGSDVGEGDCHCHQYLGWCTVYATSAYRSSSEYSGRTL